MLAYGRLLRLSLAPSALADIAAGMVLGAGHWPRGGAPFLMMAASACVYHGGMALNDWADRHEDARSGRPRPIPSGAVKPGSALALAVALLVLGPALAALIAPRAAAILAVVAGLAAFYDLRGRGPWLGPLLLAACRAGNLSAGIAFGHGVSELDYWGLSGFDLFAVPLYGGYVFVVSRLARLEDATPEELARARPARWLALAAGTLFAIGLLPLFFAFVFSGTSGLLENNAALVAAIVGTAGGLWLIGRSPQSASWTHADVGKAAGMALRRLLVATSAIAAGSLAEDGVVVAAAILLGYPLSYALRKVFPPT